MLWLLLIIGLMLILLFIYSCCVVASKYDQQIGDDYEKE